MKEMSGIVAQAFGVGIAFPVGIVGLLEASKNPQGGSRRRPLRDLSLSPSICRKAGGPARRARQAQGGARGQGSGHVYGDNIAVLKWVAEQDKMGKGKEAVRDLLPLYETESNPWSPLQTRQGRQAAQEVTPE